MSRPRQVANEEAVAIWMESHAKRKAHTGSAALAHIRPWCGRERAAASEQGWLAGYRDSLRGRRDH